jgi:hypothetical protein
MIPSSGHTLLSRPPISLAKYSTVTKSNSVAAVAAVTNCGGKALGKEK